jgi:hypothetical protein
MIQARIFIYATDPSTPASWHPNRARSMNTGHPETYDHIRYKRLRLNNIIRKEFLRMVVTHSLRSYKTYFGPKAQACFERVLKRGKHRKETRDIQI